MEQQTLNMSDYLSALKRRRLSIFIISLLVFSIGASIAALWSPTYKSSATILIKEQDIPSDLVRSTVTSFASQRIQSISQRVMARPNLLSIISKYSLYEAEMKRLTTEVVIEKMREDIGLEMISASVVDPRSGRASTAIIAFKLSFLSDSSLQAQQVANELMSLYLKENLKARSAQASETLAFFNTEQSRLDSQHAQLEKRLVEFKEKHASELPGSAELQFQTMQITQDKLQQLIIEMRSFKAVMDSMEDELAKTDPHGVPEESGGQFDPYTRLRAMRAEYLRLTARYSQDHPDVIQTKRLIEGLEREVGDTIDGSDELSVRLAQLRSEFSTLKKKYSEAHPDVVKLQKQISAIEADLSTNTSEGGTKNTSSETGSDANNPVYLTLQKRLASAAIRWDEYQIQGNLLKDKLARLEKQLASAPRLEMEYKEISSKLKATTTRRQEIQEKQVQAKVALDLEKERKGERFEIIEPPVQPAEPISPNRPAILIISLLLALASGFGYAILRETMSDKIRGNISLIKAVGAPPLAIIPYLKLDSDIQRSKRNLVLKSGSAVIAVLLAAAALHYFWTPLDVLWYKTIRKADIVINT